MSATISEYGFTDEQGAALERLQAAYAEYVDVVRAREPEQVEDFTLTAGDGSPVRLSELFGERDDLIVIHNMGGGCSYCTMWADGLNGLLPHLEDRATVVLVSPDAPEAQAKIAAKRGWKFRMLSDGDRSFSTALGFASEDGMMPGFSTFRRGEDAGVVRVSSDAFGPGDLYNAAWPMFEHLAGGPGEWFPKLSYTG